MTPFWQIHFLNARHTLTPVMPEIRASARLAVQAAAAHADLPTFDLVVQAGRGIPEWGVGGHAPAPGTIHLTIDPARFSGPLLIRTMVHELHHLIRWDGPGYGRSLGAALVSEGLAGHFVTQVLGGPPDPWDTTVAPAGLTRRAVTEWAWLNYDHATWFFGTGNVRKWAGYGLGHRLVGAWLTAHPGETAASLAGVPAETLRPMLLRLASEERADAAADPDPETAPDAPPETPPETSPDGDGS